jgi:hypothetical protein
VRGLEWGSVSLPLMTLLWHPLGVSGGFGGHLARWHNFSLLTHTDRLTSTRLRCSPASCSITRSWTLVQASFARDCSYQIVRHPSLVSTLNPNSFSHLLELELVRRSDTLLRRVLISKPQISFTSSKSS